MPGTGKLIIHNEYPWRLDPRLGAFTAYLDGRKAARIEVGSWVQLEISSQVVHRIRVRLWWYLSPRIEISLPEGDIRRLYADALGGLNVASAKSFILKPFSALYLGDESRRVRLH
jgi:hypothetical protein